MQRQIMKRFSLVEEVCLIIFEWLVSTTKVHMNLSIKFSILVNLVISL